MVRKLKGVGKGMGSGVRRGEEGMWFGKVPRERVQQRLEPGKVKMSEPCETPAFRFPKVL